MLFSIVIGGFNEVLHFTRKMRDFVYILSILLLGRVDCNIIVYRSNETRKLCASNKNNNKLQESVTNWRGYIVFVVVTAGLFVYIVLAYIFRTGLEVRPFIYYFKHFISTI